MVRLHNASLKLEVFSMVIAISKLFDNSMSVYHIDDVSDSVLFLSFINNVLMLE